jgi:hypothetical protein
MAQQENNYSYSTQPHAAPMKGKGKYRDESEEKVTSNHIMTDPRVIRGSTYAAKNVSESIEPVKSKTNKMDMSKRKQQRNNRLPSPPPVPGRVHMDMQTDEYLEELMDRPSESNAETQTQPFMDRPPSPLFIQAKIGTDIETQILPGDLFDFDLEVEPILEVLVGKTIHISMLELMQEEELRAIRVQQEEYETIRNLELAEVQRLEAEARRKAQERDRRIAQEKKRVEERRMAEEKIAARAFSKQYMGNLHTQIFDALEKEGVFYDPVEKEVRDVFLVSVIAKAKENTANYYESSRLMTEELINAARSKARQFEAEAVRLRNELRERLEEEARQKAAAEAEIKRLAAEAEAEAQRLAEGGEPAAE